jgi:hypothetical protein
VRKVVKRAVGLQSLAELEALLGRRRPFISFEPPSNIGAHWYCGCLAAGPSLDELALARMCSVHAAGRIVAALTASRKSA